MKFGIILFLGQCWNSKTGKYSEGKVLEELLHKGDIYETKNTISFQRMQYLKAVMIFILAATSLIVL